MKFCSPFDTALAQSDFPAIYVLNAEGEWKISEQITRDAWTRNAPRGEEPTHLLVRDRSTGLVSWLYLTDRSLLQAHPRLQVRAADSEEEARAFIESLGPACCDPEPWPECSSEG